MPYHGTPVGDIGIRTDRHLLPMFVGNGGMLPDLKLLRALRAEWRAKMYDQMAAAAMREVDAKNREISELLDRVALLRSYLVRYRDEVPLGHQPHMLAHLVDEALGRA